MKFSLIMPVWNNVNFTLGAIQSIFQHTEHFELIIVDNGSTDDTPTFCQALAASRSNVRYTRLDTNTGFAPAVNIGLNKAKGDNLILINNDVILTPNWAQNLLDAIPLAEKEWDVHPIGIVGPCANNAGGNQKIETEPYEISQLQSAARAHHKQYQGVTKLAGFLSGMCMLITRPCFQDLGLLDQQFAVGGVEDTEYCLRAQLTGWKLAIDYSTYIHHFGQQTISKLPQDYVPIHRQNQLNLLNKYYDDSPKKLVAMFRVRNQPNLLQDALDRAAEFADEAVVLCDRCTDNTPSIAQQHPLVARTTVVNEDWDLGRDRNMLYQAALELDPNWVISLDADERIEASFTRDFVEQLMHPIDPNILAYSFQFCTFFLGDTHWRSDGIFGKMRGLRMWKVLPNSHPRQVRGKTRTTLHCPAIPPFNVRPLRTRIKHYGYHTPELQQQKYDFYTAHDPNPDKGYIGPRGYDHLIDPSFSVIQWKEKNDLALCMIVKDEEVNLFGYLHRYHRFFDQIVVVDTGSTDRTVTIAKLFGAEVHHHKWRNSFSEARNFAKSKCHTRWIFTADPDEEFSLNEIPQLYRLLESNVHGWLFTFINFRPDGSQFLSDNVRLLRNIPHIQWAYCVHENLHRAQQQHNLTFMPAPFRIKHYGYCRGKAVDDTKDALYSKLLQKDLKDNPEDPLTHFHYAFLLFKDDKPLAGIQHLKYALKLRPDLFIASRELGTRYLQEAQKYMAQAAKVLPPGHYHYHWAHNVTSLLAEALHLHHDHPPLYLREAPYGDNPL